MPHISRFLWSTNALKAGVEKASIFQYPPRKTNYRQLEIHSCTSDRLCLWYCTTKTTRDADPVLLSRKGFWRYPSVLRTWHAHTRLTAPFRAKSVSMQNPAGRRCRDQHPKRTALLLRWSPPLPISSIFCHPQYHGNSLIKLRLHVLFSLFFSSSRMWFRWILSTLCHARQDSAGD